jgi:hypothetical protein
VNPEIHPTIERYAWLVYCIYPLNRAACAGTGGLKRW